MYIVAFKCRRICSHSQAVPISYHDIILCVNIFITYFMTNKYVNIQNDIVKWNMDLLWAKKFVAGTDLWRIHSGIPNTITIRPTVHALAKRAFIHTYR
jgi:hypothetical protein